MNGEVVVFQLFDVGGTFDLPALERSLSIRHPRRPPHVGKGTPPYVEFPRPLIVDRDPVKVETPLGSLAGRVTVAYFPIGAVSIRFRVAVQPENLAALRLWGQSTIAIDGTRLSFEAAARGLLEQDRAAWEPCVRDRYTTQLLSESYTAFCFSEVGDDAEAFLERHASDVAGLLKAENGARLHPREAKESLKKWYSYYADDLVVMDWDAAFIIDPDADYEDLLFVLEIANLQLLEFRSYDDYLDDAIAKSYDELALLFRPGSLFRNARRAAHEFSLLRLEIAELADEADNITKFLGDWWLARIYQAAQEKFHLPAWRASVDEKLGTLHHLYQLAIGESDSRRMLILELLIVLLFVLDLVVLAVR